MRAHLLFASAALAFVGSFASGATIATTLVEDTHIAFTTAGNTATNVNQVLPWVRNAASATRVAFVQFTIPVVSADEQIVSATFSVTRAASGSGTLQLAQLATNPNLSTFVWNTAVAQNIVTGVNANGTGAYGSAVTPWSQLWTPSIGSAPDQVVSYVDTTSADGLLKFVRDTASPAEAKTVTIAINGDSAAAVDSVNFQFHGQETTTSFALPSLTLETITAVPEPALASVAVLSGGLIAIRRPRVMAR